MDMPIKLVGNRCFHLTLWLLLLTILVSSLLPVCFAVGEADASIAISQAEQNFKLAYVEVAESENAGANISLLLNKLEVAARYLSESDSAFRVGDYESAFSLASECSISLQGVVSDAERLKINAEISNNAAFLLTAVGSGIGIGLILFFGFLGWRYLKKWYLKRVLNMKPSVVNNQ
jgi:hypothetical protein